MQDDTPETETPVSFDTDPGTYEGSEPVGPERLLVTWNKKDFEVVCTQYVDNQNTCIVLLNLDTGTIEAKASANLSKLPAHQVYIKDYSENRGIAEVLSSRRLIRKAGSSIRSGSEEFELYDILPRLGKHFGIKLPEAPPAPILDPGLTQISEADPLPVQHTEELDAATTHAEMESQQHAALVQKAQDDGAEEAAIAEDAKTDPPAAA